LGCTKKVIKENKNNDSSKISAKVFSLNPDCSYHAVAELSCKKTAKVYNEVKKVCSKIVKKNSLRIFGSRGKSYFVEKKYNFEKKKYFF
jgi:hypothetical protein